MNIPVYGQNYREIGAIDQPLRVSANLIPNMHVRINAGAAWISSQMMEYAGGQSQALVPPTIGTYVAVIALRNAQITVLYGDIAQANPMLPTIPNDALPLAAVLLNAATTQISNDMIQDIRPFLSVVSTLTSHSDLKDLDIDNIHPISSIIGLQDQLNKKLELQDVETKLSDIAQANGTTSTSFAINKNAVGLPTASSELIFARGALGNAGIRFNEETDILEYCNGDGEWHSFDSSIADDPFNQENIYWKADIDKMVSELNKALKLKANSARVEELATALANVATIDYVNNQFLNLYSKQDLDSIVSEMRKALRTIQSKVDLETVYSKEESDQQHEEIKNQIKTSSEETLASAEASIARAINNFEPRLNELKTEVEETIDEANQSFEATKAAMEQVVTDKLAEVDEQLDNAISETTNIAKNAETQIAQANANAVATVAKLSGELEVKFQNTVSDIEATHEEFNNVVQQVANDFSTLNTNVNTALDEYSTKLENSQETINNLVENKADKANIYTKDETYTQDELYTRDEVDDNINSAINDALDAVNDSLNEVLGKEGSGLADTSIEETLAETAQLIIDVAKQHDDKLATAIAASHDKTIDDAKTAILETANIDSFDNIATKNEVQILTESVDTKLAAANTAFEEKATQLETTIADNKADVEDKITTLEDTTHTEIESIKTSVNELANTAQENLDTAVEDLNSTIDTTTATLNERINLINTSLTEEITNKFDAAGESIDEVEQGYKEADTALDTKYAGEVATINTSLTTKANADNVYTKAEIDQKFDEADLSDDIYVKNEVDSLLDEKANIKDVYKYTESQVNNILAGRQNDFLGYTPEDSANKNMANGYVGLNANRKISLEFLPDEARQSTHVVANRAARNALTGMVAGEKAFETSTGDSYIYDGSKWVLVAAAAWENINLDFSNIANAPTTAEGYGITDVYTKTVADSKFAANAHTHAVSDIETDDEHLFISAAQIRALNGKADLTAVYTKDSADSLFVKQTDLDTTLSEYTNTEGVNAAITTATAPLAKAADVYTKSDINNLLNEKANNSDLTTVQNTLTDTINTNKETINTKFNDYSTTAQVDAKIAEAVDTVEANIEEAKTEASDALGAYENTVNTKFNDYSTTTQVDEKINTAVADINTTLEDYALSADVTRDITAAKTELTNIITTKETTANASISAVDNKVTALDTKVNNAITSHNEDISDLQSDISDLQTKFNDYSTSDQVDEKINTALEDYKTSADTTTEIQSTVDSAIVAALNSVNTALENATGDNSTGGNDVDVTVTVAQTASLITKLDTDNKQKFTDLNNTIDTTKTEILDKVRNEIVEEVITDVLSIDDLSKLATKADVDTVNTNLTKVVNDAKDELNGTIEELDSKVDTKQNNLGFTPENIANKNQANGYAGLDANGKVSLDTIPDLSIPRTYVIADTEARNALQDMIAGAKAFETSTGDSYIYDGSKWVLMADADWANVNLDFSNIVNAPTTIEGYGITDAYTKEQVDNAITNAKTEVNGNITTLAGTVYTKAQIDTKVSDINSSIDNAKTELNGTIDSTKTELNSSITTLAGTVYTKAQIDTKVSDINSSINSINDNVYTKTQTYTKEEVNTAVGTNTTAISAINTRVGTLETDIATKANAADVYAKNEVYTKAEVSTALNAYTNTENLTTELAKKVDHDEIFNNSSCFETKFTNDNNSYATLFNETSGGGALYYNATHDVISFVGVNEDGVNKTGSNPDLAANVKIYSKYKSNTVGVKDQGSYINVNTEAAYYIKGTSATNTANREIAVLADIEALQATINGLVSRIEALEEALPLLRADIDALQNNG